MQSLYTDQRWKFKNRRRNETWGLMMHIVQATRTRHRCVKIVFIDWRNENREKHGKQKGNQVIDLSTDSHAYVACLFMAVAALRAAAGLEGDDRLREGPLGLSATGLS